MKGIKVYSGLIVEFVAFGMDTGVVQSSGSACFIRKLFWKMICFSRKGSLGFGRGRCFAVSGLFLA